MTDLVVMSLEAWDAVWRRNQYLMAGLLRSDPALRVLFVEPAADPLYEISRRRRPRLGSGVREVTDVPGVGPARLWAFQPTKALPRRVDRWHDARAARAVARVSRRLGMRDPVLWINDPNAAGVLETTGWPALYDVTDDWLLADRAPTEHARLVRDEALLMRCSAEVTVCSPALARVKGAVRPVTLIPNAVDAAAYRGEVARPVDLPAGRVAVYVGTVHRDRMDLDLCAATARRLAGHGRVVLVGPAPLEPADLDDLLSAGVVMLGAKDRSRVPGYLRHADVLLVPHVVTPFTDSLDPIKVYEYRAAGRPVVSTPVAGFRDSGDPRVAIASGEEFVAAVVGLLAGAEGDAPATDRGEVPGADLPTWDDRVRAMREVLVRVAASSSSLVARGLPARRVALNGKWTGQALTGTQRYAAEIMRRLVVAAPDRFVLHIPADGAVPAWASGASVRRSRLRGNAFEQVALPWAARRDLLLSLGGPAPLLARRQVVTMHDATPFRFPETYSRVFGTWYRLLYRVLGRTAGALLTVSRFSAGELSRALGVPVERFHVVPDGADHLDAVAAQRPRIDAHGLDADGPGRDVLDGAAPFALCLGTLAKHKNLAPALAALEAAGIPAVVVGPRGARRIFESAGAGAAGAVVAGRLTDGEVAWLYRHAHALVFPSLYEGFGLPIVEAQRAGCPVICSDLPFAREVAGQGAIFVDPNRPQAFAEAFRLLRDERGLREGLVAEGRRNAERFLWDQSAHEVTAVLDALGVRS